MTSPKSQRRLNLDADIVGPQLDAVVRAVHHDAPHADRFETGETVRDPVLGGDRLDGDCSSRRVAGHKRDKSPKFSLVGVGPKWTATCQRPSSPSNAAQAVSSASRLSPR